MSLICSKNGCTRAATRTYKKYPEVFHCDECAGQTPIESHAIDATQTTTVYTQSYLEQVGVQFVLPNIGFCSSNEVEYLAAENNKTFNVRWLRNTTTDGAVEPKTWESWQYLPVRFPDKLTFDMQKGRDGKKGSPKHWFAQVKALLDACTEEKIIFFSCQKKQGENGYWRRWQTNKEKINPRARFAAMLLAKRRDSSYVSENDPKMKQLSYDRMLWMSFTDLITDTVAGQVEDAQLQVEQGAELEAEQVEPEAEQQTEQTEQQAEQQAEPEAEQQVEPEAEQQVEPEAEQGAEQKAEDQLEIKGIVEEIIEEVEKQAMEEDYLEFAGFEYAEVHNTLPEEQPKGNDLPEPKEKDLPPKENDSPDEVTFQSVLGKRVHVVDDEGNPYLLQAARSKRKYKLFEEPNGSYNGSKYFQEQKTPPPKTKKQIENLLKKKKYKKPQEQPHEFKEKPDLKIFKLYD